MKGFATHIHRSRSGYVSAIHSVFLCLSATNCVEPEVDHEIEETTGNHVVCIVSADPECTSTKNNTDAKEATEANPHISYDASGLLGGAGFVRALGTKDSSNPHPDYRLELLGDDWSWKPFGQFQQLRVTIVRAQDGGVILASDEYGGGVSDTVPKLQKLSAHGTTQWRALGLHASEWDEIADHSSGGLHFPGAGYHKRVVQTGDGRVYMHISLLDAGGGKRPEKLVTLDESGQELEILDLPSGVTSIHAGPGAQLLVHNAAHALSSYEHAWQGLQAPSWTLPASKEDGEELGPTLVTAAGEQILRVTRASEWTAGTLRGDWVSAEGEVAVQFEIDVASGEYIKALVASPRGGAVLQLTRSQQSRTVEHLIFVNKDGTQHPVELELPDDLRRGFEFALDNDGRLAIYASQTQAKPWFNVFEDWQPETIRLGRSEPIDEPHSSQAPLFDR